MYKKGFKVIEITIRNLKFKKPFMTLKSQIFKSYKTLNSKIVINYYFLINKIEEETYFA